MQNLNGQIVVITGGSGMLGCRYMKAVEDVGGYPINLDIFNISEDTIDGGNYYSLNDTYGEIHCDITKEEHIKNALSVIKRCLTNKPIYGLINNAAIDPKFDKASPDTPKMRLECYSRDFWDKEIAVGLTGAFLCTKHFGSEIAKNGKGSIINISSVLGLIAPNQDLYKKEGIEDDLQSVKPITYSVIKHAIIGLTRYTATYWAGKGVRCNAVCPGGVYNDHPSDFVNKLSKYIPLGRMAEKGEYNELIKFLLTDASSFMTGAVIPIDGGQSTW